MTYLLTAVNNRGTRLGGVKLATSVFSPPPTMDQMEVTRRYDNVAIIDIPITKAGRVKWFYLLNPVGSTVSLLRAHPAYPLERLLPGDKVRFLPGKLTFEGTWRPGGI